MGVISDEKVTEWRDFQILLGYVIIIPQIVGWIAKSAQMPSFYKYNFSNRTNSLHPHIIYKRNFEGSYRRKKCPLSSIFL